MGLWLALITAAYLVGSVPFGLLLARTRGVDIRQHGSGNIGASNVGRILGKRLGLLCFGLDVLKGLVPTLGAGLATGTIQRAATTTEMVMWLLVMAAPVAGHMFSPWLGFKGGKGVATGLGSLLGFYPLLTLPGIGAFVVWFVLLALFRYIGLASSAAALTLPLWVLVRGGLAETETHTALMLGVTGSLAAIVVWKHRGNLARTVRGEEPKVTWLGGSRKGHDPGL